MSRPASAQVPEMSEGAKAMWDRLEFVSIQDMQAAMVKANVPDAGTTSWKIDLINLAMEHGFNYVVPRMRLTKAAPLAAIPHQPPPTVAAAPFAAIPLQPPPASSDAPPAPSAMQGVARKSVKRDRAGAAPDAVVQEFAAPDAVVQESIVAAYTGMGVAGKIMNLYEGKWSQVFAPTPLSRGFIFVGEFTCEEIKIEIQKMALDSGCLFWKTDTATIASADGFVQSMTFKCPHFPDPNYYKEKKGRKTTEDAHDAWRNVTRNGQHVTGTLCPARFTINGKKTDDTASDKYIWRISPLLRARFSMTHVGHPEPYAKYLQKMVLNCAEKKSILEMVNAGLASNQISAFLSSNGQKGAISKQTIGFIASEISKWDTEMVTIRSKAAGVSAAQALVDNLQALPHCTVVMLYKDIQSADNQLTSMIAGNAGVFKVTDEEMDYVSRGNEGNDSSSDEDIQSPPDDPDSLLGRTWTACCSAWKTLLHDPIKGAPPRSQLKPATATENDKNRMLTVNGKQCLLLALLWAFDEEKTMFSKYPEVLHHDVKGKVCQWGMPWWFSVGVNGRRGNFIALRGWIHNESRAMFRFCEKALVHVHGKYLKFCVCHCCDGDPDLIAVLLSMCAVGGSSPWARLIRCFWHIENRGIIHEFKNLTDPWIRQLISILWRTCMTLESPQEFYVVWTWVVQVWTPRVCGRVKGFPIGEQCTAAQAALLPDFLDRIYITREYWCLAWKLTIPAMNTNVNTRAETENGVLVKHVHVHGGMAPGRMAEGEARVTNTAYQREHREDFSNLNRQVVGVNECEKLMTAGSYAIQHHQVLVAQHCYNEGSSSIQLCTEAMEDCDICSSTMLPHQGGCRDRDRHPLWFPNAIHDNVIARFHTKISYTEPLTRPRDELAHSGAESTYSQCPWPAKRTRIVTVHLTGGIIYLLCSCGNDIREMCACRHVAVILGCITDQASWGEEALAIHLRHLIGVSYWNVLADLPVRAAYDFLGTATAKVTAEQLMEYKTIRELISKSTVLFEVDALPEVRRLGNSTCSMRQAKQELQVPFNKLCNTLYKKITSANTLTTLKANNDIGTAGMLALISQFPDAAVSSGDSAKRIPAAGERRGKRSGKHKHVSSGKSKGDVSKKRDKTKHLTSKK